MIYVQLLVEEEVASEVDVVRYDLLLVLYRLFFGLVGSRE